MDRRYYKKPKHQKKEKIETYFLYGFAVFIGLLVAAIFAASRGWI